MKFNLAQELRMVQSQKRGLIAVTRQDRDWDSGKPMTPKDIKKLKRIFDMLKIRNDRGLNETPVKYQKQRARSIVCKSL